MMRWSHAQWSSAHSTNPGNSQRMKGTGIMFPRTDQVYAVTGDISKIPWPTGIAPRSSIIGSMASMTTSTGSGSGRVWIQSRMDSRTTGVLTGFGRYAGIAGRFGRRLTLKEGNDGGGHILGRHFVRTGLNTLADAVEAGHSFLCSFGYEE